MARAHALEPVQLTELDLKADLGTVALNRSFVRIADLHCLKTNPVKAFL
ncbi:MAG: hypothetical protein AAF737_07140 [Pseudomonadota bacterium]